MTRRPSSEGATTDEERRPAGDLLREAVERYLKNRRWQRLFVYGEERARALGLPRPIFHVSSRNRGASARKSAK
jgi:DNA invertase Pin-like site-specific DNA recombinase